MRKLLLTVVILLTFFSYLYSALEEMENEYIKIIGDPDTGRFIIKTTGGDPQLDTDQDSLLLYEDYPPTSFATIRIDERDYKFGDTELGGYFVTRIMKRGDRMVTVWAVRNIEVTQTLKFVNGPTTGRPDTVDISYTIWNKDAREHNIGIRILLDTYLGKSDGAPFRIPEVGEVTTEKEFVGNLVPSYWYSYDDLGEPTVRAQGTVIIEGAPIPNRIVYASWERFNKYLWDFEIKPGRTFRRAIIGPADSSVAVYWDPHKYNPNDTYSVKTYYGLYGATIYKGNIFNVSLGGPVVTSGEPLLVTVDIQNISPYNAQDVTAEILLPTGLKLMGDEMGKKAIGSLNSQEIKKTSFNIFPDGSVLGIIDYKVKVSGMVNGKLESIIVERKVNYKGPEKVVTEKFQYTLYDFTEINKLIADMNELLRENNSKIDELNKLIETLGPYSGAQATNDREGIKQRTEKTKNNEAKLPDAVKSVEKVKEGEKKR